MLENVRKEFIKYVKTFDLKDQNIMNKFHHSFRVMEYSKEIANSLNLNEKDIELAEVIGLLHDISRFKQWTIYKTYNDNLSFDHGDESVNILKENNFIEKFNIDKKYHDIIYKALKNHNKYQIEDGLNDKELIFSKIIRDADKIDIIKEQGNKLDEVYDKIDDLLIKDFYLKKQTNNLYVKNERDHIIRMISFVYDFNFKYTFNLILKEKVIENKFNLLINYSNNQEEIEDMEKFIIDYMKERC